jgi:hypothetical protein
VQRSGREALYKLQEQQDDYPKPGSILTFRGYQQVEGNASAGYKYILQGELFNTGIPYSLYKFLFETKNRNALALAGYNKYEVNNFSVFEKGEKLAVPGCLHCHAESFNGELVIGLGNSYSKFQVDYTKYLGPGSFVFKILYGSRSNAWKDVESFYNAGKVVAPRVVLEMQGPNPAHRIANVMASHRDPVTLLFRSDTTYFTLPDAVVPTDIPALWLAKKKNAWTCNAQAQGDPAKQFMVSSLLTLKDSAEAAKVYGMMKDIWAYLRTLEPPKYPKPINRELADKGRIVFNKNCSGCHGTYGKGRLLSQ